MLSSIIIDATHFSIGQTTGVENYVSSLLPLVSQKLLEKDVKVAWVGNTPEPPPGIPAEVEWIYSPHTRFWSQTGLVKTLREKRTDLFFTPSGLVPLAYRGKVALTVHDLGVYTNPESFSFAQNIRLKVLMKWSAKKAVSILTPSQFTAAQISKIWNISPDRITVTPLSLPPVSEISESITGIDPTQFLLVFTGRIERKKNLLPVIKAFASLNNSQSHLVLAGKDGLGSQEITELISSLPPSIQARIHKTGYISDNQKNWLLEHAAIALVPGLAEGFGLPVLEAFHYRIPSLCSNSGSLPEVGGDAAVFVNGKEPQEWKRQMEHLLEDKSLRQEYGERGFIRLQKFSWEETAQKTAQAFLGL